MMGPPCSGMNFQTFTCTCITKIFLKHDRFTMLWHELANFYMYGNIFFLAEDGITLLWHEFPNIYERSPRDFCDHYSEPARKLMKNFGATPHISLCKYEAGWPPEPNKFGQPGYARYSQQHERKARAVRTGWIEPNSYIAVSAFPNMKAVVDYYNDGTFLLNTTCMVGEACSSNGRLIAPFLVGSMSVCLSILICHLFINLWVWSMAWYVDHTLPYKPL